MLIIRSKGGQRRDEIHSSHRGFFAYFFSTLFKEMVAPYAYSAIVAAAALGLALIGLYVIGRDISYFWHNFPKVTYTVMLFVLAIFHLYLAFIKIKSATNRKK